MYERSYYYAEESLVFLTREDARHYFFDEQLFSEAEDDFDFGCFLSERYSLPDIFRMDDTEKADVLLDYHTHLFELWFDECLTACDMYED